MATTRLPLVAFVLALVPACNDDNDVVVTEPVAATTDEGFARGDNLAATANAELSSDDAPAVIGRTATILAALNTGEILQAQFAEQVVSAPDVLAYANQMIVEHSAAATGLSAVVRIYGVPFLPSTTAGMLTVEAMQGLNTLRTTPPGEVDFQYIQLQVIMHAGALVLLDELSAQVGPGIMGDFIADTRATVDMHLAEAQDILATFF